MKMEKVDDLESSVKDIKEKREYFGRNVVITSGDKYVKRLDRLQNSQEFLDDLAARKQKEADDWFYLKKEFPNGCR